MIRHLLPQKGQIWRHFKGNKYRIMGIATPKLVLSANILYFARDSEDFSLHPVFWETGDLFIKCSATFRDYQEEYVIYQDLSDKSKIWARDLVNFCSVVKVSEYFRQERFQLVGFCNESESVK